MSHPRLSFLQSILFIDDQTKFESLIRGGLFSLPAQYEFCPSRVPTVLERLRGEVPDLIVSTLEFTEGSVFELFERSEGILEGIPALYLTEPHLADLESEVALRNRVTVLERSAGPLNLIERMTRALSDHWAQKSLEPTGILAAPEGGDEAESAWVASILKKTK